MTFGISDHSYSVSAPRQLALHSCGEMYMRMASIVENVVTWAIRCRNARNGQRVLLSRTDMHLIEEDWWPIQGPLSAK